MIRKKENIEETVEYRKIQQLRIDLHMKVYRDEVKNLNAIHLF